MKPQKFITTELISESGKDGELKVWNAAKSAFSDRDCIGYWRYPLFAKVGEVRKEPDVLIADRELGVILIEIACVTIDQIVAVNGEQWQFENSDILLGSPGERVNRQLQALLEYCDRESQIFRKITGRGIVALPLVKQEEWQQKGFDQLPGCPPVIFQEQFGKVGLLERIQQSTPMVTGENLNYEQWAILKAVIGGTPVLRKQPRTITLQIADDRLLKLEATATNMGVSVEELLLMGVEAVVNQPEVSFPNAMAYVLNKNTELYKRLQ